MSKVVISEEVLESKEYKKVVKVCGEDMAKEFFGRDNEALKNLIALNTLEIQAAKVKKEHATNFQSWKENTKLVNKAFNEAIKPTKASIDFAVYLVNSRLGK